MLRCFEVQGYQYGNFVMDCAIWGSIPGKGHRYFSSPNVMFVNVSETGIGLPGRSEVGLAVVTPYRLHLCVRVQVESNTVTTMDIGQSEALFRSAVSVSRRTKPVKAVPDLDWQSVRPAATGCNTEGTASSKATSASRPLTYFLHPKRSAPGSQPAALSPGKSGQNTKLTTPCVLL